MSGKAILCYTTTVAVDKTVGEVMSMLARAGAKSLQVDYQTGTPVGVQFLIQTRYGDRGYKLPVNIRGAHAALRDAVANRTIPPRFGYPEQAARVAWRIAREWLEVQLALIDAGMAELTEVMLPWMLMSPGVTAYEQLIAREFPRLPGGEE